MTRTPPGERGSSMVLVLVLLAALIASAGMALYVQLSDTRSVGLVRQSRDATFCAEAGLAVARAPILAMYAATNRWGDLLDGTGADGYPITGDMDGDEVNDYSVTVVDDDDELPPAENAPTVDNNLKVFLVSVCTKNPDAPREIRELVGMSGLGHNYRDQAGQGAGNTGNAN